MRLTPAKTCPHPAFVLLLVAVGWGQVRSEGAAIMGTRVFEDALQLSAGGSAINLTNHVAPRVVDWNNDGNPDILVGGGDGYAWLFTGARAGTNVVFASGARVQAGGTPFRAGTGYTTACFVDMTGDGLPDLVAAGSDNKVRLCRNTGTLGAPVLAAPVYLQGASGDLTLPANTDGRIDAADWDGDGRTDLFVGGFDGFIRFYRNTGTAVSPGFAAAPVNIAVSGQTIQEPHNTHPKLFDVNGDGTLDLVYGVNWGYAKILINTDGVGTTHFNSANTATRTNGAELNIRALNGDDLIPDFADLNGDGVLDMVSGGKNGRVFVMYGVPYTRQLQRIGQIMLQYSSQLGSVLRTNAAVRAELFELHQGQRTFGENFLVVATNRMPVRDWYAAHINQYPQFFMRQYLNPSVHKYVPHLAGQVWVNLLESMPDSEEHRRTTAVTAGFTGTYSNLLVDLGILFVDNSLASSNSQQSLFDIARSMPRELWSVECVTHSDYLDPAGNSAPVTIAARSGVNLFAKVGDYSEGFPADVPQSLIDGFCAVVSHELNHNVEAPAGRLYPWYWDRKFTLLEQAAPPDVVFMNRTNGYGRDLAATKARFLSRGYWNGQDSTWDSAWNTYWSTGPGQGYEQRYLRDNLKLCIEAPQEAFATLANQYFTDSETMLELGLRRWQRGVTNGIDQMLFFADVYSLGGSSTWFYRVDTAGKVTRRPIPISRDGAGRITGLRARHNDFQFQLSAGGNVTNWTSTPVLEVQLSGGSIVLAGPQRATNFLIQSSSSLGPSTLWTNAATVPPTSSLAFQWTVSTNGSSRFFRLIKP